MTKYLITRTSYYSEDKTPPHPDAVKTKFTSRRDIRFFKTIEEFKKNCSSAFKDNPETGYTKKGLPFRVIKKEFEAWTIDIEDLASWVNNLGTAVIITSNAEEFPEFPDICELEIYDDYRE